MRARTIRVAIRKPNASKQQMTASGSIDLKIKLLCLKTNEQIKLYPARDGAFNIVFVVVVFDNILLCDISRIYVWTSLIYTGFSRYDIASARFLDK